MIEFVKGTVNYIDTQYIVIDVNGVGYQIYCANPFIYKVDEGSAITVYTYQYVREDAIKLFGFRSRDERALFEKLLNVSGIGPKGALAILASGQPQQVVNAIEEENEAFLTKFPGVGKKTARQMILDLKGKLEDFMPSLVGSVYELKNEQKARYPRELEDAIEALQALGYVEREIKKIAPKLAEEQLSTDQYIKKALQLLLTI
ncbi:Holliday junction branch migration protein RuvA [Anaerobacillus isosaccharinicus]|uniref:Holliday junction branch migration complex subunit RuvA n=1 Tax=Anaerobacillus isosaccharinicus TaxID=1532552 RepID=A0A1S2KVB5_9BACI|nr:Holliday junction branch migration protein RuvA [Anaerobacillus isosaccharinicus]MBA5585349.1 Holliday junction branch migration protein RuvA [Anaerobacillus isosaccharinicus]QOY36328.1 Holliday junction branch migration protein RuvA [Anaerobacillus isosaccharinicus]